MPSGAWGRKHGELWLLESWWEATAGGSGRLVVTAVKVTGKGEDVVVRYHQKRIHLSSSQEEEKLQTLANFNSLYTSSNGSISSGITSGYNSSPAFSGHLQSLEVSVSGQTSELLRWNV